MFLLSLFPLLFSKFKTMTLETALVLILIGLAAGTLGGMMGVGGAIIMIPAMVYFLGMSQHSAQGTSLAVMLPPVGFLAVYNYYKSGEINIKYAIVIGLAFVIGGYFGSKLSLKVPSDMLRKIFGVFMLLMAIQLIFGKK
jgi:uncharacterized protein